MAKFTSTVPLNIRWLGNDINGAAGATHRIPDALYDEFNAAYSGIIPGLTWVTQDEASAVAGFDPATKYDKTGGTISGAVTITGALVAQTSIISPAVTATTARFKGGPWFDVKAYGALGDSVTDDTTAVQAAIAAASVSGGTVVFSSLCKVSQVTVLAPNVHLIGTNGGGIFDGTIRIGSSSDTAFTYYDVSLRGMRFARSAASSSVNAVELQRAYRVTIEGCHFERYNANIFVMATSTGAHVGQVNVLNCTGTKDNLGGAERRSRYLLYVSPSLASSTHSAADFTVNGNNQDSLISNVACYGIDGLIVSGNVFFMGSYSEASTIKQQNILVDYGQHITITGNLLFEAGYEAILLNKCQSFTVSANDITWAGERDLRSAIAITGGDLVGSEFGVGAIVGNTALFPSKHGCSVEGPSGNIVLFGNNTRAAGYDAGTYYGASIGNAALSSITHYGINVDATCNQVHVVGNHSPANLNQILGIQGYFALNLDSALNAVEIQASATVTGGTAATVGGFRLILCNAATAHTIDTLLGGVNGAEIVLLGVTGNTTIQNNAGIRLKGSVNAAVPVNGTLTLRYMQGNFYELARSF